MATPFWEARMRAKQIMKYYEERNKAIKEATHGIKSPPSTPTIKTPYIPNTTRGFK